MKKGIFVLLWMMSLTVSSAHIALQDSLSDLLQRSRDVRERIGILINLQDVYESTDKEFFYACRLYKEAKKVKDKFAIATSLGVMAVQYLDSQKTDSLELLLKEVDSFLKGTPYDGLTTYYRMVYKARIIQTVKREDRADVCEKYLAEIEANKNNGNLYEETEWLFLTGIITYQLMSLSEKIEWEKGLPYWEKAWENLREIPLMAKRNFAANLCVCLMPTYNLMKEKSKFQDVANTYLAILDEYYEQPEIRTRRPYIYKDVAYALCYQQLVLSGDIIGKDKAAEYYRDYCNFMRHGKGDPLLRDKTFFFDVSCRFYMSRKDYPAALAYKDSLIDLIEKGKSLASVNSSPYKGKADILKLCGKYKEACEVYERAMNLKDSLVEQEYLGKVGEMRVKYEVDKLELDNANLLAAKRKIALYFAGFIIVLGFLLSAYLYWNLKKMKRLQQELIKQNIKVQESENMKVAFINSMCHEIRTPLNVISGFSEVILQGNFEPEEKETYAGIIRKNTQDLTSLLDDLLQAANLDGLTGELPTERIDINLLCRKEMDYLQETKGKQNIRYRLDLPEKECFVETHAKYFSMLVRALLDNANKFTEEGEITLGYYLKKEENLVTCFVKDTGCGIPPEKGEYIFERFAKLDSFSQGSGMGLYICRAIVKLMGGCIRLDTEYGKGSLFMFTMPMLQKNK